MGPCLFENKQTKKSTKNKHAKDRDPTGLSTAFIYSITKDITKNIYMENAK